MEILEAMIDSTRKFIFQPMVAIRVNGQIFAVVDYCDEGTDNEQKGKKRANEIKKILENTL